MRRLATLRGCFHAWTSALGAVQRDGDRRTNIQARRKSKDSTSLPEVLGRMLGKPYQNNQGEPFVRPDNEIMTIEPYQFAGWLVLTFLLGIAVGILFSCWMMS